MEHSGSRRLLTALGAGIAVLGLWLGLINDTWDLACRASARFCTGTPAETGTKPAMFKFERTVWPHSITRMQAGDCKYVFIPPVADAGGIKRSPASNDSLTFGEGNRSATLTPSSRFRRGAVAMLRDFDAGIDYHLRLWLHARPAQDGPLEILGAWAASLRFAEAQHYVLTFTGHAYVGDKPYLLFPGPRGEHGLRLTVLTQDEFRDSVKGRLGFARLPRCEDAPIGVVFAE